MNKFCGRIDRYAIKISETPENQSNEYYHLSGPNASKKFKGDVFEVFAELLIRLSPLDDRIGVHDYHVVSVDDTGVDGYGKQKDGSPITVQVKYRLWDMILNEIESHLHNFSLTSRNVYKSKGLGSILLITTGQELHWKTIANFSGEIKCISRDASYGCLRGAPPKTVDSLFSLKTLVDGSVLFWDTFRQQTGVIG